MRHAGLLIGKGFVSINVSPDVVSINLISISLTIQRMFLISLCLFSNSTENVKEHPIQTDTVVQVAGTDISVF